MRAGPLSNDQVIRLLNAHFVPVFVSNEDYAESGPASDEERAERNRIWREAREAGLSAGTVHAYILTPEGESPIRCTWPKRRKSTARGRCSSAPSRKFETPAGQPVVAAKPQSAAPAAPEGGLTLHLVARYLEQRGDALAPLSDVGLGQSSNASWQAYPAENWIVLDGEEVSRLLPGKPVKQGDVWRPDADVAAKLLVHFYPSTECNDVSRNRIEEQELTATVVSSIDGKTLARLDGRLRMKHNFYPGREDQNRAEATLLGYLEFDLASGRIDTLRLATRDAIYSRYSFGAAVRSLPAPSENDRP
jgi:hypothetical protein